MKFAYKGASKGEKFHVYEHFTKAGGGKLYLPIKEGQEPKKSVDVTIK